MDSFMIPPNGAQQTPQQTARARIMQAMLQGGAPQSIPDEMNKLGQGLGMAMMARNQRPPTSLSSIPGGVTTPAPGTNIFGGMSNGLSNLFSKL